MVVSSTQVISLKLLQQVVTYVCWVAYLAGCDEVTRRIRIIPGYVNSKFTVVWVLLQLWRTVARTDTSRQMLRSSFLKVLKVRVAYKGQLEDTVFQLIGGIRSGMGYCGAQGYS